MFDDRLRLFFVVWLVLVSEELSVVIVSRTFLLDHHIWSSFGNFTDRLVRYSCFGVVSFCRVTAVLHKVDAGVVGVEAA